MTAVSACLLTTCHLGRDGLDDLLKLVASVQAALDAGEVQQIKHVVLLQGCSAAERAEIGTRLPPWLELSSIEGALSSPAARNLLIDQLVKSRSFDPEAFVGLPDDDSWYPAGALGCIAQHFTAAEDLQLLLCRYGPSPSADRCGKAFCPTLQQALSCGACAAIFLRTKLVAQLGGFHPLLGLGTPLKGGEDTELVHRAFYRAGGRVLCVPGFLVGHAAADPAKKALYYEGGLTAIIAHSGVSPAARLAMVRKLAVGAWLVLRRRMSLSQYLLALRRARANAPTVRAGPLCANPSRALNVAENGDRRPESPLA